MVRINTASTMIVSVTLLSVCASSAWARARGDFNGDGFDDLVIGVPLEDINGAVDAGCIEVIYGSSAKLKSAHDQVWSAHSTGVMGATEPGARFGASVAAGDFDGDGFDDVAIGAPHEDVNGIGDAGAVHVLYGSSQGLTSRDQLWTQDSPGVREAADEGDLFGFAVIAGDFNDDGRDDLAISAPFEDSPLFFDSGVMHVLFGGSNGLHASGDDLFHEDSAGVVGVIDGNDWFGYTLASGDFNGDGHDDLVIGSENDVVNPGGDAGSVNVLYGYNGGISRNGDQRWSQNSSGIAGTAVVDDKFGHALATGDFDHDGFDDLAIGVPGDTVGTINGAGSVHVLYGSSNRLRTSGTQFWSQNSPGINNSAEFDDQFGTALASGDFNHDGFADLAIGIPLEDLTVNENSVPDCGAVAVLYGSSSGLRSTGDQFFDQDMITTSNGIESYDNFGQALAVGDFNGDGRDDLAIAVPTEDILGFSDDGAVNVMYGSTSKLKTTGAQMWTQDSANINDHAEDIDAFGLSLGR
jgi:hypothetical protein